MDKSVRRSENDDVLASVREHTMDEGKLAAGASLIVTLILALGVPLHVHAQDSKAPYPSMAPVEQYLITDRNAEIALARSAAPESISRDATILVLGRLGYETAVEGTNGFVCGVERSWISQFEDPNFWNPKIRGAVCYNPAAARSILPIIKRRTELAMAGLSKAQMVDELTAAYAQKQFPVLEPGAMSYTMSKGAVLDGGGNLAHLMFYTPADAKWGENLSGSPVSSIPQSLPDRFSLFMIPTARWSDGTPAPLPK